MKKGQFCMNDYCKFSLCMSTSVHLYIFGRNLLVCKVFLCCASMSVPEEGKAITNTVENGKVKLLNMDLCSSICNRYQEYK